MTQKLVASIAAPAFGAASGVLLSLGSGGHLTAWGVVAAVVGVGCTVYVIFRDRGDESTAQGQIQDLKAQVREGANGALSVVTSGLSGCLDELDSLLPLTAAKRAQGLPGVQATAVSELLRILEARHDGGRVTLFVLNEERTSADPEVKKGRRDTSRPFKEGTARGDAALTFMLEGQGGICNDVDREPWDGWQGTRSRYRAFMSTPVTEGERVYGLLTYDLPQVDELSDADLDVLEAFATFIGVACHYALGRA
ncbi:GAF domain-containing protein [Kocuria palustris]|uniref:GAF domain-containing protein n=1 Tax=Kocuria palustris TaxID=71999 RepID=UPI0024683756|nr:GAF domain-containing protein [Kocuria palustris]MDH5151811.1 GAF domain-containing protein [Kocuria palustris]